MRTGHGIYSGHSRIGVEVTAVVCWLSFNLLLIRLLTIPSNHRGTTVQNLVGYNFSAYSK